MSDMDLSVVGLGLWSGGITDPRELRSIRLSREEIRAALPSGQSINKRDRRRATALSRAAADAFFSACTQAKLDPSTVPTVFASALGETPAMIELVDLVCRRTDFSPMRFAMSTHSSSSTIVSISQKNRGFTTSLSANYDTVAAGLIEMAGILATSPSPEQAGVLVIADDHSPDQFLPEEERYCRIAAAFALRIGSAQADVAEIARLSLPSTDGSRLPEDAVIPPCDLPLLMTKSPVAGALDLLAACVGDEAGWVNLDRGKGAGYALRVSRVKEP